jgi:DNA repair protein RadC
MLALQSAVSEIDRRIPKLRLCLVKEKNKSDERIFVSEPEQIAKIFQPLKNAAEEYFVSLHLNSKNQVLGIHEVSHGTISTSLVHPREVFKAALLANSYAIVVCHNHPSGANIAPSHDDYSTTRQLIKAGLILGVNLLDHVIVGPSLNQANDYFSFRENYPDLWDSSYNDKIQEDLRLRITQTDKDSRRATAQA